MTECAEFEVARNPRSDRGWINIVAVAITFTLGLGGCEGTDDDPVAGDTTTTTTSAAPTTTTTTATPTTTTTATTTTTTAAPTTTSIEMTPELAAVPFLVKFEEMRETVIAIFEDLSDVESVDMFVAEVTDENDILSLQVILDVTSTWSSSENQREGAWVITRVMTVLYDAEDGAWYNELWTPPFNLTNSGTNYLCTGEFMAELADARKSMADWLEECG